jgi:hypothetical protein
MGGSNEKAVFFEGLTRIRPQVAALQNFQKPFTLERSLLPLRHLRQLQKSDRAGANVRKILSTVYVERESQDLRWIADPQ